MISNVTPTGVERYFGDDEIIVSKTDLKGHLLYANSVFVKISGYTEEELLGEAHNIIRHPLMPKCIFKLAWETISSGKEIFAYVVNMCKNGDHYWVYAHMTPTFGPGGSIVGYHSSRRVPERKAVSAATSLYEGLLAEERRHSNWREGMDAAARILGKTLEDARKEYDEFVFSL